LRMVNSSRVLFTISSTVSWPILQIVIVLGSALGCWVVVSFPVLESVPPPPDGLRFDDAWVDDVVTVVVIEDDIELVMEDDIDELVMEDDIDELVMEDDIDEVLEAIDCPND